MEELYFIILRDKICPICKQPADIYEIISEHDESHQNCLGDYKIPNHPLILNYCFQNKCPGCYKQMNFFPQCKIPNDHEKCIFPLTIDDIKEELPLDIVLQKFILPEYMRDFTIRDCWQKVYQTWSFPPTLQQINELITLIGRDGYLEVGAGSGFLACILQRSGINFIAVTDINPYNPMFNLDKKIEYTVVESLSALDAVQKYGKDSKVLLSCWGRHEYDDSMLDFFAGEYIVDIGENEGGCCGFGVNLKKWMMVHEIKIPTWFGLRDTLKIYERIRK